MLLPSHETVGRALARILFILASLTHGGKGIYHKGHPHEVTNFKSPGRNAIQMESPRNWTSTAPWRDVNATASRRADGGGGDAEEDMVLVGYGHDPWGPSSPMEAGGQRGRGLGAPSSSQRPRRNVVHLYNMVLCATGCNPVIYKGYGCYCGFLGSGAPIDGIDRCCKMHDWCYNTANCPMFFEYFVPYYWKCYHHRPLCAIDHGVYGGPGSCAQRLCECDRLLSECLSHYRCPKRRAVCRSSPVRFLIQSLIMF